MRKKRKKGRKYKRKKEKRREKENKRAKNREYIRRFHKIRVVWMDIFQKNLSTRNLKKFY